MAWMYFDDECQNRPMKSGSVPMPGPLLVSFQWKNPDFLLKNPEFLLEDVL